MLKGTRQLIKEEVQRLVKKQLEKQVPHECWSCAWFTMRKQKPRNRGCHYPGPIKVIGGIHGECQMWELEPDPKKRRRVLVYD